MHMSPTHTERIQILISPEARREFEAQARLEGLSLSAWLRAAGEERVRRSREKKAMRTREELERFFAARTAAEQGTEPDWGEHLEVMRESRSQGVPRS